ncbi:septation protein SepH [Nonomuraea roseola]|uniref:septation protein SepH n=1 Tax=Nonomuraea roseola TaxID=46179 RepID=UPI003D15EBF7
MQELRLVSGVSEDGTYLVAATAGSRDPLHASVDDRLRAAVRETSPRLASTRSSGESVAPQGDPGPHTRRGDRGGDRRDRGNPRRAVRWFEGPVARRERVRGPAGAARRVRMPAIRIGPTLGELVAERLSPAAACCRRDRLDSAKRDDGLWRVKLGYVWNGHTRHAEWLFRTAAPQARDPATTTSRCGFVVGLTSTPNPPVEGHHRHAVAPPGGCQARSRCLRWLP